MVNEAFYMLPTIPFLKIFTKLSVGWGIQTVNFRNLEAKTMT